MPPSLRHDALDTMAARAAATVFCGLSAELGVDATLAVTFGAAAILSPDGKALHLWQAKRAKEHSSTCGGSINCRLHRLRGPTVRATRFSRLMGNGSVSSRTAR